MNISWGFLLQNFHFYISDFGAASCKDQITYIQPTVFSVVLNVDDMLLMSSSIISRGDSLPSPGAWFCQMTNGLSLPRPVLLHAHGSLGVWWKVNTQNTWYWKLVIHKKILFTWKHACNYGEKLTICNQNEIGMFSVY